MYKRKKQKTKKTLKYILIMLTLTLLVFLYLYTQYQYFITTPVNKTNPTKIILTINKGDSTNKIAENLYKKELILNKDAFKLYAKLNKIDTKLIPGKFLLNKTQTIPEIIKTITSTKPKETILTIPEGYRIKDIDKQLTKQNLIKQNDFITAVKNFNNYDKYPFLNKNKIQNTQYPLEGYLFPDTYFINKQTFTSQTLITLMLNNFQTKLNTELTVPHQKTLHEYIIMASIIEREVRKEKEKKIVSGILWKRLENGWTIGADATLLYLKDNNEITYKDLQQNSKYNTRKNLGLPPTPISNPGLESIKAAMYPTQTEYYFYLTTLDTGEVIYSKTNEEHNKNKNTYL